MSRMACVNCNYVMSNTTDDNRIEHFLIETWIENLYEKKYKKVLLDEIATQQEFNEHDPGAYNPIDPWFAICSEFGRDVWICPECQTMHIFSKEQPTKAEKVYRLMERSEWDRASGK